MQTLQQEHNRVPVPSVAGIRFSKVTFSFFFFFLYKDLFLSLLFFLLLSLVQLATDVLKYRQSFVETGDTSFPQVFILLRVLVHLLAFLV